MKKLLLITFILPLIINSCCKRDSEMRIEKDAILKWTGGYEVDGCGFFIVVDNKEYKPDNENSIDSKYKNGQTNVKLIYNDLKTTKRVQCGMNPAASYVPLLHIVSIKDK